MLKGLLSHRVAVVALVLSALVVSAQAAVARQAQIRIGSNGQVETGVIPEPAECLGPLSPFFFEVLLFVFPPGVETNVTLTASLTPGWEFIPDSCVASNGLCEILDPANLSWAGVASPENFAEIDFAARVNGDVPIGTTLCATVTATFGAGTPISQTLCEDTNSARQCGLGAPALGSSALGVLVALLFVSGFVLIRRRA